MFTFTISGEIILQDTVTGKWSDTHITSLEHLESLYGFACKHKTQGYLSTLYQMLDYYNAWKEICVDRTAGLNHLGQIFRQPVEEVNDYLDDLKKSDPRAYAVLQSKLSGYEAEESDPEDHTIDIEDYDEDLAYEDDMLRSVGYY